MKQPADQAGSEPGMKVRDVIRRLVDDGWVQVTQKGSHRQFKHPTKPGKVTVPGKPSDDLPEGTYRSIQRQAGLKE
jgi:predicted RNA binding protein YcfA (HicA-like mRNA interferase family)